MTSRAPARPAAPSSSASSTLRRNLFNRRPPPSNAASASTSSSVSTSASISASATSTHHVRPQQQPPLPPASSSCITNVPSTGAPYNTNSTTPTATRSYTQQPQHQHDPFVTGAVPPSNDLYTQPDPYSQNPMRDYNRMSEMDTERDREILILDASGLREVQALVESVGHEEEKGQREREGEGEDGSADAALGMRTGGGTGAPLDAKLLELWRGRSRQEVDLAELQKAIQASLTQKVASLEEDKWMYEREEGGVEFLG